MPRNRHSSCSCLRMGTLSSHTSFHSSNPSASLFSSPADFRWLRHSNPSLPCVVSFPHKLTHLHRSGGEKPRYSSHHLEVTRNALSLSLQGYGLLTFGLRPKLTLSSRLLFPDEVSYKYDWLFQMTFLNLYIELTTKELYFRSTILW